MSKKISKLLLVSTSLVGIATLAIIGYQKCVELKKALDDECDCSDGDYFTQDGSSLTKK